MNNAIIPQHLVAFSLKFRHAWQEVHREPCTYLLISANHQLNIVIVCVFNCIRIVAIVTAHERRRFHTNIKAKWVGVLAPSHRPTTASDEPLAKFSVMRHKRDGNSTSAHCNTSLSGHVRLLFPICQPPTRHSYNRLRTKRFYPTEIRVLKHLDDGNQFTRKYTCMSYYKGYAI